MKNERTPRTLADCQWVTGYSTARKVASELVVYLALVAFLFVVLFGFHAVARYWG